MNETIYDVLKDINDASKYKIFLRDKTNDTIVCGGATFSDLFDNMYAKGLLDEKRYFNNIRKTAIAMINSASNYEKESFLKRYKRPLELTDKNIHLFECHIEDSYKQDDILSRINHYCVLSHFVVEYGDKKGSRKRCLIYLEHKPTI
jgi:hypothetical protein